MVSSEPPSQDLDDASDVQAAAIALIIEAAPVVDAAEPELSTMTVKALKRRARSLGIDEEQIEDLDDAPDVKAAAIALIQDVDMASEEEQSTKELEPEPEPEPEPKLAKAPPQESPTKVAQTFL